MITESPHRARFAAVPAVLSVGAGVGLGVGGWLTPSRAAYLWGMVLVVLGGWLLLFVALPMLWRLVRAGLCLVLAAVVVAAGLWVPQQMLAAEFAGENVRWSIPSRAAERDVYYDHEVVMTVFGDVVVLANRTSARLVSLADGRELGTLPADRDDRFSIAGERLLVVRGRSAMLYDRTAKRVWPSSVTAERGVAAFPGRTVVEHAGVVSAVDDDGTVRWTRQDVLEHAYHRRFPNVLELPDHSYNAEKGPPVLPTLAALPVAATSWEFVDADGTTVARADGEFAGSVGDRPITVTPSGDRCAMWRDGEHQEVWSDYCRPWAQGDVLFFTSGIDAWAVPSAGGAYTELKSAALSDEHKDRRLAVSETTMAWRDSRLIRGYPGLGYGDGWRFVAESEQAVPYVGDGTVVVQTALRQSNPLDPRAGMTPGEEFPDEDYRITVLDAATGRVTGSIRAHLTGSITPLRSGTALLAVDGKIMLVGS